MLATISIVGVFLVQFAFIRSSYNLSEKQFQESAAVALKEVAWQVMLATGTTENFDSITPVEVISNNTYLVNVGVAIDKDLLKQNLNTQLKRHDIYYDYEFAIYNPTQEQMDETILVHTDEDEEPSDFEFVLNENYSNYFGIHFADRTSYFFNQLSIWYFLTALLMLIIFFFGYTLWVIIRQRQLSEIQKNFINNLTHELKTPISSIALAANVINDEKILKSPKRLFEYTRIIQDQTRRLSKNVEKVLNLASIEKSRIHLNLEKIELADFLNEASRQFRDSKAGQQATVSIEAFPEECIILADRFHFANLVSNILENAAKYCEKTPAIRVELKKRQKIYELNFIDNGIGIPREHRKRIFKKFYRVPTGNVHNVKGFGLGLDYVYKIVKTHNWKIKVADNPDGGSIFSITIPN
ncbi:HAMP domain-containing sensor histidine kinase [Draconibacterium sp. IB214405]|uniref:sensor histidine kinase n=1 Tax=Draconibacterium sp. IB214405 TaxID=3097352 RepID=UPI002A157CBD|nr:HAMP domain-containing sensor histidine kinase [Draconibacterium sp. IB214405]MDX8340807.1 HAMP domain-containing sensor histidine kinase [Draconibacterium sp. IB214405]